MNEPLLVIVQRLQNTLVPAILAGSGSILIIASVVGTFWKREITSRRRKAVGCFGTFFLLSSIFLYGGPLLLHVYAPTITFGQILTILSHTITFLSQTLLLLLQELQYTAIPPILAGTGCVIIITSILGIFAGRKITCKQQVWTAFFGTLLLLCGILSYEVPLLLPSGATSSNIKENLNVLFREGKKVTTTKLSYHGITTITISGEAKASGVGFADAFYFYGHATSQPIHRTNYTIWINGKPVDAFVRLIPPYKNDHSYTFKINASGGHLTFSVGSGLATDKTGYFIIDLS